MKRRWLLFLIGAVVVACIVIAAVSSLLDTDTEEGTQPAAATAAPLASDTPQPILYFCGYDRCRASGEYGQLTFPDGIIIWSQPEVIVGQYERKVAHHDEAVIIQERRVFEGPGGLWYELKGGGWTHDLWLTEQPCNEGNLEQYSFTDCMMGEY